jgi:WD40 repeat protein
LLQAHKLKNQGSHDGRPQLLSAGGDKILRLWDLYHAESELSGQELVTGHSDSILAIKYYTPLDVIITASEDRTIRKKNALYLLALIPF